MTTIVHHTACPVCNATAIQPVLTVKDHTVSGQSFELMECSHCSLRFTQDVPDAASISAFYKSEDYISHTNTSKGLVNTLYQKVRERTLVQKANLIDKHTQLITGNLLDLGCGVGSFLNTMQQRGWQVTGVEPDADARAKAKELYNIHPQPADSFYDLAPGSFDAITMWHVLEHVHDLHDYIAHLKALLKPDGKLFIAVPNYTSTDAEIYGAYWAAYDVPRHLYHFSPKSVQVLMQQHGLKITDYLPMWFDSFYISMLSSKYKNGKMNLPGAGFSGLRSNLTAWTDTKKCSSVIYVIGK